MAEITLTKNNFETEVLKSFEGIFEQLSGKDFGFCDHVFIDTRILKNLDLANGDHIHGTAIISYNKRREEWGWKAIKIES